jgi:hypothetical protein
MRSHVTRFPPWSLPKHWRACHGRAGDPQGKDRDQGFVVSLRNLHLTPLVYQSLHRPRHSCGKHLHLRCISAWGAETTIKSRMIDNY